MLKQKLKDQLKNSMLAKDALKTSVLRLLLSAITYYEIQKGGAGYEATDEDLSKNKREYLLKRIKEVYVV